MLKDDLSEIELLIHKGTPVTIILNRNRRDAKLFADTRESESFLFDLRREVGRSTAVTLNSDWLQGFLSWQMIRDQPSYCESPLFYKPVILL